MTSSDKIILLENATADGDGDEKQYTMYGETQLVCVGTFDGATVTPKFKDILTGEEMTLSDKDGVPITFTSAGIVGEITGHYNTTVFGNVSGAGASTDVTLYFQSTSKLPR